MGLLSKAKNLEVLIKGISEYRKTGLTPMPAYYAMRALYVTTQGRSNPVIGSLVQQTGRPCNLGGAGSLFGNISPQDVEQITNTIRTDSYYHFPQRLPDALCDRLVEFALTTKSKPTPPRPELPPLMLYDRADPKAISFHFSEQSLFDNPDIQELATDPTFLSVARSFLGCPPVLDLMAMWWSTAYSKVASTEIAQLYHFDLDRLKFLKFFIYLTDVTVDNGPHVYVTKSHRRDKRPKELWRDGRIPDADVEAVYPKDDIIKVCAPRGSVFVGDTTAFHKGTTLESGDRLVLEIEYCTSLFGSPFVPIHIKKDANPRLLELVKSYPNHWSKFILD